MRLAIVTIFVAGRTVFLHIYIYIIASLNKNKQLN